MIRFENFINLVKKAWRKLPVRVGLFALFAVLAVVLVDLLGPYVPDKVDQWISTRSVDRLLDHIASAMLVVTTFSLTVMVSVHQSSASQWTPRVHQLLMEDTTTQNTLATFVGAYVYALTAIALREMGLIANEGATLSFAMTLVVLMMVVGSLIRWIFHLQTLGSLIDIARQIEAATQKEFDLRYVDPCMGGHALTPLTKIPDGALPIPAPMSGYVTEVHAATLNEQAQCWGVKLYIVAPTGAFVALGEPIAYAAMNHVPKGQPDDESLEGMVKSNMPIGDVRSYHQDPRLGLIVMAEVGSKALSPGINDSGTALDVIHRQTRLLLSYQAELPDDHPKYGYIYVPPLTPEALVVDAFDMVARDGANLVEVQIAIQEALRQLRSHSDPEMQLAAQKLAAHLRACAERDLTRPHDKTRFAHAVLGKGTSLRDC